MNNSTLIRDQKSEYCNNKILKTENVAEEDLTTVGFGTILIIIGLIIVGTSGIWLIARRRKERTEEASSLSAVSMKIISNR